MLAGSVYGVYLRKIFYTLLSTGSTQEMSHHDLNIVKCDVKHNHKTIKIRFCIIYLMGLRWEVTCYGILVSGKQ